MPTEAKQLWFTFREACRALSMETSMFRDYVERGVFPRGIRRGKRRLVWHADDLAAMEWIERNRHRFRRRQKKLPEPGS